MSAEDDGPEIFVWQPPRLPDDEIARRAEQEAEARRRYRDQVVSALVGVGLTEKPVVVADRILDALFVVRPVDRDDDRSCSCSCHPQLPTTDFHGYGFDCVCRKSLAERRASWDEWERDQAAYWASAEGLAIAAARDAEERELDAWAATETDVTITSFGGMCPEQWRGDVDGHSFYFRERNDEWRIELDLRPSGRFVDVWKGGDLDNVEPKELDEGVVIARGTTSDLAYGTTHRTRCEFIVRTIRDHLRRQACTLHAGLGPDAAFCPACGLRL